MHRPALALVLALLLDTALALAIAQRVACLREAWERYAIAAESRARLQPPGTP
jgi:hypothetical protein